MRVLKVLMVTVCAAGLLAAVAGASSISMKLSGEGVVNDSTVKAGTPVNVDIYIENDSLFTGFSFGFIVTSPDIKKVIHVADSGNGLNKGGDIKGHNGWQDASIWNFGGVYAVERDWDGNLPDMIGFGGLCIQQEYSPHDIQKVLSFTLVAPDAGTVVVDSAFYPPGGRWLFATPSPAAAHEPDFGGALTFKVVK